MSIDDCLTQSIRMEASLGDQIVKKRRNCEMWGGNFAGEQLLDERLSLGEAVEGKKMGNECGYRLVSVLESLLDR